MSTEVDGDDEIGPSSGKGERERLVVDFSDEPGEDEPTAVLEQPVPQKPRRIIVEDEDYFDEDLDDEEFEEFEDEVEEDHLPEPEKSPGRTRELLDRIGVPGKQLAWLAAGAVIGCLAVSLFTVYAVTSWTGLLPSPEVGRVGETGKAGLKGPGGLRGKQGKRGHKGPQGDQGPRGEDGPRGTVTVDRFW